jgi:ribosomal-protein-alanine N-acetyltransferase
MRDADLADVLAVETAAYPFPWTASIFRDCLRVGYCCWVCVFKHRIVGHGVMSVAAGEAHVLNLCVKPEYQGNGLGKRLLSHLLSLAARHGADTAFLEVRRSNSAALALYSALGFNEIGVRRGYYPSKGGREDALVLARDLGFRGDPPG